MPRNWYRIEAKSDAADIYVYDYIGTWGVEAGTFTKELAAVKDRRVLNLYINSPGGDVFEGMTIYNALLDVRNKLTAHVMGLAASMASVILLAASTRVIHRGAMVMVHNPWGGCMGTARQMRDTADVLDKITDQIALLYQDATGADEARVRAWMDAETWFNAEEALEHGFASAVSEQQAAASIKQKYASKYRNVPGDIVEGDMEPTIRTAEDALRDAGFSSVRAKAILAKGFARREDGDPCHREDGPDYSAALEIVKQIQDSMEAT
jgi:ATP-dependent Clp endopeptidase proteolytic subunit ClpP